MTVTFQPDKNPVSRPRITVIGVGGAGGNAVNNMIRANLEGVDFVVCNTDAQALAQSNCERRIQLGTNITQGLGAGARADIGRSAAEEVLDDLLEAIQGSNMVFVAAGMGGGTGTGAAPVIARVAREQGILTVGVVTKPFVFEGTTRMRQADTGIEELQKHVDTLIVIPNQNLFRLANEHTTFADAFKMADDVLYCGVRGVTDLMIVPGLVNLDFADVRTVMSEMGKAMMGTGESEGQNRSLEAAEAAISNPLLDEISMRGAKAVLINITGGMDMTLFEVDVAAQRIREECDADANIIWGSALDQSLEGKVRVTVVATGIEGQAGLLEAPTRGSSITAQQAGGRAFLAQAQRPVAPPAAASAAPATARPAVAAPVAARPAARPELRPEPREQMAREPAPRDTQTRDTLARDTAVREAMAREAMARDILQGAGGRDGLQVTPAVQQLAQALGERKLAADARPAAPAQPAAPVVERKQPDPRVASERRWAEGEAQAAAPSPMQVERTAAAAAAALRAEPRGMDAVRAAPGAEIGEFDAPAFERRPAAAARHEAPVDDRPFIAPPPVHPSIQAPQTMSAAQPAMARPAVAAQGAAQPAAPAQAGSAVPQQAGAASAARAPSLFERVTGAARGKPEPQRGAGEEDLLDIPAFLRRQAN